MKIFKLEQENRDFWLSVEDLVHKGSSLRNKEANNTTKQLAHGRTY
jgi:hypothetical protein